MRRQEKILSDKEPIRFQLEGFIKIARRGGYETSLENLVALYKQLKKEEKENSLVYWMSGKGADMELKKFRDALRLADVFKFYVHAYPFKTSIDRLPKNFFHLNYFLNIYTGYGWNGKS